MHTPDLSAAEFDALLAQHGLVGRPARSLLNSPPHMRYERIQTAPSMLLLLFPRCCDDASWGAHVAARLGTQGAPCLPWRTDAAGRAIATVGDKAAALASGGEGAQVATADAMQCAAVGGALARFHLAGKDSDLARANAIGPAWWRECAATLAPALPPDEAELLREEIRFQSLHRFHDLPRGLIVGMPARANVWWSAGAPRFISADRAATDLLLFDVALAANDWCVDADGTLDAARTRALLHAYASLRPLTALERGAWPVLLRGAALQTWLLHREDAAVGGEAVARLRRSSQGDAEAHRVWPSMKACA